ncbi:MAG: hypothetical protein M1835_007181 [Candelina submexicana]|nr:MAG: hypothetical protein M1835_007181 [Candelina submexicana]
MPKNRWRKPNHARGNAERSGLSNTASRNSHNHDFSDTRPQRSQNSCSHMGSHPIGRFNSTRNNSRNLQSRPNPLKGPGSTTYTERPSRIAQAQISGPQNQLVSSNLSPPSDDPITSRVLECIAIGKDIVRTFEELLPDLPEMDWEKTNTIYWVTELPGVVREWKTQS